MEPKYLQINLFLIENNRLYKLSQKQYVLKVDKSLNFKTTLQQT